MRQKLQLFALTLGLLYLWPMVTAGVVTIGVVTLILWRTVRPWLIISHAPNDNPAAPAGDGASGQPLSSASPR